MANRRETYISFMMEQFKLNSAITRKEMLQKFTKKYKLKERSFDRYWKIAKGKHDEFLKLRQEAEAEAQLQLEMEGFKESLKSKLDLQISIQRHIDTLEALLIDGTTKQVRFIVVKADSKDHKPVKTTFVRNLTPMEIRGYHRELKGWYKELALLAGYYSPTEVDLSGDNLVAEVFKNILVGGDKIKH